MHIYLWHLLHLAWFPLFQEPTFISLGKKIKTWDYCRTFDLYLEKFLSHDEGGRQCSWSSETVLEIMFPLWYPDICVQEEFNVTEVQSQP